MSIEQLNKIEVEKAIKIIDKFKANGSISHIVAENIIYELYQEASIDKYHRPK